MVLLGMLLLSPMSSKYHFVTLVVPIAFIVADYAYGDRRPGVGVCLMGLFVVGTLTSKGIVGHAAGNWALAYGAITASTLICLGLVASILLRRARRWAAAAADLVPAEGVDDGLASSAGETGNA